MQQFRDGPMTGRTVLVTGATAGIGRATALGLAAMGAHLAIVGRDGGRAEGTAREIRAAGAGPVEVFVADMSAQAPVRRLAGEVLERLARIDVLINNVGGYWHTRHVTAGGLERTFALNHLAPFLLTNLLLDRLERSAPARVITVSSHAHTAGHIDFDDLQGERSYSGPRAYDQSKLANLLFTYELARKLRATTITVNALHPGMVRTSFGAEDPAGVQRVLVPLLRPFMKSPARGASTSVHLASAPGLARVTGGYFANGKPRTSAKRSHDRAAAARLWHVSADLVDLAVGPPHDLDRAGSKRIGSLAEHPDGAGRSAMRAVPCIPRLSVPQDRSRPQPQSESETRHEQCSQNPGPRRRACAAEWGRRATRSQGQRAMA